MVHIPMMERRAELEAMLHERVARIAGVEVIGFTLDQNDNGILSADCELAGWGPTLHSRVYTWRFSLQQNIKLLREMATGLTFEEAGEALWKRHWAGRYEDLEGDMTGVPRDEMAKAFSMCLDMLDEEQGALARVAAAENGLDLPIPVDHLIIGQMHMDRRMVTIMVDLHGARTSADILREAVGNLIDDDPGTTRWLTRRKNPLLGGEPFHEIYQDYGARGDAGIPYLWMSQSLNALKYDGATVTLASAIPETVAAMAIGMRLGDVVSNVGHRVMDEAVIEDVQDRAIVLRPDLVRLGDHPGLIEALAHER